MGVIEIIGGFVLLVLCVLVIAAVVMQESPKGGLGTIAGESTSTFFDKNRGKTKEAMLVRATSICGVALAVLTLVLLLVI